MLHNSQAISAALVTFQQVMVGCNASTLTAIFQGLQQIVQATISAGPTQSTLPDDNVNNNRVATHVLTISAAQSADSEKSTSTMLVNSTCKSTINDNIATSANDDNRSTTTMASTSKSANYDDIATNASDDEWENYECDDESGLNMDSGIEDGSTRASSPAQNEIDNVKRRNDRPEWYPLITFTNISDFNEYMKKHNFATSGTEKAYRQTTRYMRCNLVRKNGVQCAARLCVRLSNYEKTWVVLSNRFEHTHQVIKNKLAPEVRKKVALLRKQRIVPKKALEVVREEFGEDAPTLGQIYHCNRIEDARNENVFSTLGQLAQWVDEHTTQTTYEKAYVLNFRNSKIDDARTDFQYVVSTPRLLEIAAEFNIISVDATYKVNEHDYPVIFVGGIDVNQRLHIIAYSVTTREETANYSFLFESLKTSIWRLFQKDFNPEILISDAAGAISKGFKQTFPGVKKVVMCWFHLKQAIVKKLGSNEHREEVILDINKIHLSHSQQIFDRAVLLFHAKWNERLPDFCRYFKRYWVDSHSGWFAGYAHKCPCTNNGMEGHNSGLKRNQTFRELMPLGAFNTEMFHFLNDKSLKYDTQPIPKHVSIDKELWLKAIEFNNINRHCITIAKNMSKTIVYIPSSESIAKNIFPTTASINFYEEIDVADFDEFMDLISSMWKLEFDHSDYECSICSCPQWNKRGICKHLVGVAIQQNKLQPPPNVNPAKLRRQLKRMPRKNAVKALTRQPNFDHAEFSTSQSSQPSISQNVRGSTASTGTSLQQSSSYAHLTIELPSTSQNVCKNTARTKSATHKSTLEPPTSQPITSVAFTRLTRSKSQTILCAATTSSSNTFHTVQQPQLTTLLECATEDDKTQRCEKNTSQQKVTSPQLQPGTLFAFGAVAKETSFTAQCMFYGNNWTMLPPIIAKKEAKKITRHNASYIHIGDNRIAITGGVDSQSLKRVCRYILLTKIFECD